jgi:hypothetical protein
VLRSSRVTRRASSGSLVAPVTDHRVPA